MPNCSARRKHTNTHKCSWHKLHDFMFYLPVLLLLFPLLLAGSKTSNKLKINLMRNFHWGSGYWGAAIWELERREPESGKNDCKRQKSLGQANENVNLSGTHAFFPQPFYVQSKRKKVLGKKRGKSKRKPNKRQTNKLERKKGQAQESRLCSAALRSPPYFI